MIKNMAANAGDLREVGLIPGLGRSPGGGHGDPLQYSCLENSMDGGAWQAIVSELQRVGHDRSDLACMHICNKYKNSLKYIVCFYILNLRNLACILHLHHVLIQSSHSSMFNSYTWVIDTILERAVMRNMTFILNLSLYFLDIKFGGINLCGPEKSQQETEHRSQSDIFLVQWQLANHVEQSESGGQAPRLMCGHLLHGGGAVGQWTGGSSSRTT